MKRKVYVMFLCSVLGVIGASLVEKRAQAQGQGQVKPVVIGVDANGIPTVSPGTVTLSTANGDTVRWFSSGISFQITFPSGSPFVNSSFAGSNVLSGAIQHGSTGPYNYTVTVGNKSKIGSVVWGN